MAVLNLWFPGRDDDGEPVPCPVSGVDMRFVSWEAHHWISADTLWHHGLAARVIVLPHPRTGEVVEAPAIYHPFIGVPLAAVEGHAGQTSAMARIPRGLIPSWTWQLAAALDDLDPLAGPQWATERLLHDYPEGD